MTTEPTTDPTAAAERTTSVTDDFVDGVTRLTMSSDRLRYALADQLGVRPVDLRALTFIEAEPNITPKTLGERLDLSTGTLTPLLDRLEQGGLLKRHPNPGDRRSSLLHTTPSGRMAVAWSHDHTTGALRATLKRLDDLDPDTLLRFLDVLSEELDTVDVED